MVTQLTLTDIIMVMQFIYVIESKGSHTAIDFYFVNPYRVYGPLAHLLLLTKAHITMVTQ